MSKTGTESVTEKEINNVYIKEDITESQFNTLSENNINSNSDNDDELMNCPQGYAKSLNDGTDVSNYNLYENDTKNKIVPSKKRITKPILYRYEYVALLGTRAEHLAGGAKPMIKNAKHLSPKEIANYEIKNNILPLILRRTLPDGTIELWKMGELDKSNIFN